MGNITQPNEGNKEHKGSIDHHENNKKPKNSTSVNTRVFGTLFLVFLN